MEENHQTAVITHCSGKFFIWDHDDVINLRKNFRICGSTVGSLPRKPWQNNVFSLPVILMPEEVHLCLSKDFALLREPDGKLHSGDLKRKQEEIDSFNETRRNQEDDQIRIFKRDKREKAKLYYGRKKMKKDAKQWYMTDDVQTDNSLTNESDGSDRLHIDEELSGRDSNVDDNDNIDEINGEDRKYYNHSLRIHIPTKSCADDLLIPSHLPYPKTEKEKLSCIVYEDLWNKGYYVTSAEKFGGDFLVYSGDPLRFHSKFIVIVMGYNQTMSAQQLVLYGRLGSSVKKTIALASVRENTVHYTSLTWRK